MALASGPGDFLDELLAVVLERRRVGWNVEELLALQVEMTHALIRVMLSIYSKKGTRLPKPLHLERPFEVARRPRRPKVTAAQADRWLADRLHRG